MTRSHPPVRVAAAIPAYEAGSSIAGVVLRTRERIGEVVVVDDGSSDETGAAARRAGARVLRHSRNRGKGAALRTAFDDLLSRGFDAVLTLDADGQHLPEEIPKLLEAAGADLVIGGRDHLFAGMRPLRRTSNRLSSRAISLVAGCRLSDVQSGFRLYRRTLLEITGFPECRFDAESAVVVRAVRRGLRVVTVPVRLGFVDGYHTSHYRAVVDSLRIARAVTRARFEARP
ncbi:MAG: glycosyltransferase family 2 protein [Acidobacteriota bacterium]|jgi:glycosyltransferase involved in cell wall biosynthesis